VRCPIFVAREWFRHRVGSFNEMSGRYTELADAFYVPAADDVRTQVGKPGAYTFEPVEPELAERTRSAMQEAYASAYATYRALLDDGIAKEVARSVLPVGIYTEFFWTVNARSVMHFLSLRNDESAQREIRVFAAAVEELWGAHMPVTHAAFVANDRTAP
ncbi:MAG: thymidylate synthase, partial [Gaiellaceae bacterium]|nr:thymidylate synthase [Gaiellaceae bacterium]